MSLLESPVFSINDIFLIITMIECLILASYRLFIDKVKSNNSFIFSIFLLVVVIEIFTNILIWNENFPASAFFIQQVIPYLYMICQFAKGPLFLLFVYSITLPEFQLRKKYGYHFILMLLAIVLVFINDVSTDNLKALSYEWNAGTVISMTNNVILYFIIATAIGYALAAFVAIRNYHQQLQEHYSSFSTIEINWLMVLSACFIVNWGWYFVMISVADNFGGVLADVTGMLYNYITFILINALFVYSLFYSQKKQSCKPFIKKVKSNTHIDEAFIEKIHRGISEQKLHLEVNINIDDFSNRIGVPSKLVSHALNNNLGKKFFEFINFHRIEVAKSLLADQSLKHLNILDILLMSGFNNKSSFHRFFNRLVDISPTEYRKQMSTINKPSQHKGN